jgi:leucine-zipper of insertion element IS481
VSHANAALTPRARARLARLIVEEGWKPSDAAKLFMVSTVTARKWAARWRAEGLEGMQDRSSRPHASPTRTSPPVVRQIVRLRWRHRPGPDRRPARYAGLDGPRRPGPLPPQPAVTDRSGDLIAKSSATADPSPSPIVSRWVHGSMGALLAGLLEEQVLSAGLQQHRYLDPIQCRT